jgi:lysylphosphatidylglycerol synthetase-like protein (DUF2156 family)
MWWYSDLQSTIRVVLLSVYIGIVVASVVFGVVAMLTMILLTLFGLDSTLSEVHQQLIRISIGGVAYMFVLTTQAGFDAGIALMAFLVCVLINVGSDYIKMKKSV